VRHPIELSYGVDDWPPWLRGLLYGLQWTVIFLPTVMIVSSISSEYLALQGSEKVLFFQRILDPYRRGHDFPDPLGASISYSWRTSHCAFTEPSYSCPPWDENHPWRDDYRRKFPCLFKPLGIYAFYREALYGQCDWSHLHLDCRYTVPLRVIDCDWIAARFSLR